MSKLFETSEINGMQLSNRFVRSATWEGLAADDGACTPEFKDFYLQLARGGVGLIITSHTFVRSDGRGTPRQLGLHTDELIPGLQDLTNAVSDAGLDPEAFGKLGHGIESRRHLPLFDFGQRGAGNSGRGRGLIQSPAPGIAQILKPPSEFFLRGFWIGVQAQSSFGRMMAGSLTLTFFVYIFVNMGMVAGLLPVVGVPLPLVSAGGTSVVTLMAGFGILMAVSTEKRMVAS